jgi:hypothetical protein
MVTLTPGIASFVNLSVTVPLTTMLCAKAATPVAESTKSIKMIFVKIYKNR